MLTASISLGAVGPWIIFGAMRKWSLRRSFWVIILLLGIALVFPVYLSVSKKARSVVDWNVKDRGGEERPKSQRRQSGVITRRRRSDEDEDRGWGRRGFGVAGVKRR